MGKSSIKIKEPTGMKLIDDKSELKQKFLEVSTYLFERGEMLKAYCFLLNGPSILENDRDVLNLLSSVQLRLGNISEMMNYGTIKGKFNRGFVDPENIEVVVKFQKLRDLVMKLNLKKLVDIGCYTAWIGRELNLLNIAVHGIDVHPVILTYAGMMASGTLATHEYLPVEKLGFTHPMEYDGAILFDVLEHVFDYNIAIKSAEMSVKDDGWLFYNIPHPESEHISPRFEDPKDREHLHSFSRKRLEKLFDKKKNIKIEEIKNEMNTINWWVQYQV